MIFREARIEDIQSLHRVRLAVRENALTNPASITESDYDDFLTLRGKGWLCEVDRVVVGFAIIDTKDDNIWALFVHPDFERRGIGSELQRLMLDWHFGRSEKKLWLGTAPNTRAERFYRSSGWLEVGRRENGEAEFEMTRAAWNDRAG